MSSWSESPFPPVQQLSGLEIGATLHEHGGQCRRITLLNSHPGWLYKEYRVEPVGAEVHRIDRLVSHPGTLGPAELRLIDDNTSWPATRVVDGSRTLGVCLPLAPRSFHHGVKTRTGSRSITLQVDLLALPDLDQWRRGIPGQSLAQRVTVCASLAQVGALLERHGLVYLDWSFANAFWSPDRQTAYVIDIDGCSFGPRHQIQCHNWDDPLVPQQTLADSCVDRYRVALLVARCLTAHRGHGIVDAVQPLRYAHPALTPVCDLLVKSLTAPTTHARPELSELSAALTGAAANMHVSNVVWKPIDRTRRRARQQQPAAVGTAPGPSQPSAPPNRPSPEPSRGITAGAAFAIFLGALALLLFVLVVIL